MQIYLICKHFPQNKETTVYEICQNWHMHFIRIYKHLHYFVSDFFSCFCFPSTHYWVIMVIYGYIGSTPIKHTFTTSVIFAGFTFGEMIMVLDFLIIIL